MTPDMGQQENKARDTQTVLTHALERAPLVDVPHNFAASVCAALSLPRQRHSAKERSYRVGPQLAVACLVLLLLAGFRFAALASSGSVFWQTASYAVLAEAVLLLGVLGLRDRLAGRDA